MESPRSFHLIHDIVFKTFRIYYSMFRDCKMQMIQSSIVFWRREGFRSFRLPHNDTLKKLYDLKQHVGNMGKPGKGMGNWKSLSRGGSLLTSMSHAKVSFSLPYKNDTHFIAFRQIIWCKIMFFDHKCQGVRVNQNSLGVGVNPNSFHIKVNWILLVSV